MDAVDAAASKAYASAINDNDLTPACEPKMDVKEIDKDHVKFVFTIITKPEVKLGKYKGLDVKKDAVKVTKKEIEEEVAKLASRFAEIVVKENGKVDAFNQELMLRILSDDDRLVQDTDIVWYKRSDVLNNLHEYNIYMTTDFATSETEKADYSVISVWALNHAGRFHWIDGIVKRQDMAVNVDDIFNFVEIYHPLATGVEISGQQKGFVSWLKREMVNREIYFYLASDKTSGEEGLRPNTSKLTRFNIALPLFKQRKIAFPEELKESAEMIEFIDELTSVTPSGFKSAHDDCADTISQLPLIEYFVPINPRYIKAEQPLGTIESNYYFTEPEQEYTNSYIV
jgi:predicted phage terminase large subunit-like protein